MNTLDFINIHRILIIDNYQRMNLDSEKDPFLTESFTFYQANVDSPEIT